MTSEAKFWDDLYEKGREFTAMNLLLMERLWVRLEELLGRPPSRALELACGTGQLVEVLLERALEVTAVEYSSVALEKTRERLSDRPDLLSRAELVLQDLGGLTAADANGGYDLVFIKLAFTFLEEKEDFLRYVRGSLAENGVFVLFTPVLEAGWDHDDHTRLISVPRRETEELLRRVFDHFEIYYEGYVGETALDVVYLLR